MRSRRFAGIAAVAVATGLALAGCAAEKTEKKEAEGDKGGKLSIVATTGYLGDAVKNVAPEADIQVLVKPGGDPHTQELTTKDTEAIQKADLVVWTSHDMEHRMMDQFDKMGDKQLPAGEAIPENMLLPWEEDGKIEGHDPHVWNSPDNWKYVVTAIGEKLGKIDPNKADEYKKNAEKYNSEIDAAKNEAKAKFDQIPEANRYLITGHDAFQYLGKTFGMTVRATDVVSSEGNKSDKEISDLAKLIAEHKVPVIFLDNLKNPKAITALQEKVKAEGWDVKVSDEELFADTLAESGQASTYLGAFKHNADAISAGLGAK